MLHNRPQKITTEAERAVVSALASGRTVALAYADCGTYGALALLEEVRYVELSDHADFNDRFVGQLPFPSD